MKDIGRPRGLIDYATLEACREEAQGHPAQPAWKALLRPRTFVYFGVWGGIGAALLFALGTRSHTDLTVSPDRNPPFMLLSDGSVRNSYTLKLRNMESRPREMEVSVEGLPGARMWTDTINAREAAPSITFNVPADQIRTVRAYVMAPSDTTSRISRMAAGYLSSIPLSRIIWVLAVSAPPGMGEKGMSGSTARDSGGRK